MSTQRRLKPERIGVANAQVTASRSSARDGTAVLWFVALATVGACGRSPGQTAGHSARPAPNSAGSTRPPSPMAGTRATGNAGAGAAGLAGTPGAGGSGSPGGTSGGGGTSGLAGSLGGGGGAAVSGVPTPPVAGNVRGLSTDTRGVYLYTRRFRRIKGEGCTNPPGGTIDKVFVRANRAPFWEYIGDVAAELVSFTPGDPAEVSGNPIDTRPKQVFQALKTADDFQPVGSGSDGDKNYDAGTGGTITLRLANNHVIRADGRPATGGMSTKSRDPMVALDGSEIIVFEDAEFSGYIVKLTGPKQSVSITTRDYQNDVKQGDYGDDTMLAIDLDTLAGWTDDYVQTITITDDGVSQGAFGLCVKAAIDTSLELDAVAVRKDVIGPP